VSSVPPVYCPECQSEYLGTATICGECGVALVSESALADAGAPELPPVSELVCIRAASVAWAQSLSEQLAAEGISHRIEVATDDLEDGSVRRPGANLPYGVYVRPVDVAEASRVDAAFMRSQIPDLPGEHESPSDPAGCPACGAEVASGSSECSDCGLALAFDEA
jgi:hypothetical protein